MPTTSPFRPTVIATPANPTPPVPCPEARRFFDEAADTLEYLYSRWQDEKEYEDIKDYSKPLKPIADRCGVTLIAMTKKPFGVTANVGNKKFHFIAKSREILYKRIA